MLFINMISKDKLKQVLIEQRISILNKELGLERNVLDLVGKKIKLPHVVVITGLRRSGKSTLLRQIINKHYSDEDFYYINFEDERLFNFKAENFNLIYETLMELFGDKKTFFIDEIQNINNFETFVRRFYNSGFKFFITGSSANLLSKEIGTKLTGRHVDIVVKPFSFNEFLRFKKYAFKPADLFESKRRVELKKLFAEFLVSGGMPEYLIYSDPEVLIRVYEDIVIKDIAARYSLDNVSQIKELYQYLITTFSQKFSYNSLKKFIKINSVNTIKKYIDFLERTYFIDQITKFDYSLKKQLMNHKKIYVVDNWFINNISLKFTHDFGWLLENLVFLNLKSGGTIFYYSDKFECDFVVVEKKKVVSAIQVCWTLSNSNNSREVNGLLEAMKKFKLKEGFILTNDQEDEFIVDNKKIIVKPVWKWLLE